MHKFALYSKSYRGDIERLKKLKLSIDKYNKDHLPFFISCPKSDMELFKKELVGGFTLIADEDILGYDFEQSWYSQQLVKLSFYRTNLAENFLVIDSDSYFIRDFGVKDFMYDEKTPYFVCHQDKAFLEFLIRRGKIKSVQDTKKSFAEISKFFGRKDEQLYVFGSPCIWNYFVLQELSKALQSKGMDFKKIIDQAPFEMNWYGEFFLSNSVIEAKFIGPIAKIYHYDSLYKEDRLLGQSEEALRHNYCMIIMQNKWVKHTFFKKSLYYSLKRKVLNKLFKKL